MMLVEPEFEEFRALPILLQHRMLVAELDAIADVIDSSISARTQGDTTPARLLLLVSHFTQALPAHFATEEQSTTALLRDCTDSKFRRRLLELDSEHPHLLSRFQTGVQRLSEFCGAATAGTLTFEHIISDLKLAIAAFRKHEAAEDELFVE